MEEAAFSNTQRKSYSRSLTPVAVKIALSKKKNRKETDAMKTEIRNAIGKLTAVADAEKKEVEIIDRWHRKTIIRFNPDGTVTTVTD